MGAAILDRKSWGPPSWIGSDVKNAKVAPILLGFLQCNGGKLEEAEDFKCVFVVYCVLESK